MKLLQLAVATLLCSSAHAWSGSSPSSNSSNKKNGLISITTRHTFVSSLLVAGGAWINSKPSYANDDDETFEAIAARASKISKAMQLDDDEGVVRPTSKTRAAAATTTASTDSRSAYDFTLPMAGQQAPFGDIVRTNKDSSITPKAILVVNIKQDDPIARKNIPELIGLAAKYGRSGDFAVVSCPTDQGYYEPDTSALIRLKLASEYGYGINPATIVTDKVNLLGTGAHPFWRWLEGSCRTPSGLGKIQANFEKFLIDGKTGLPLRRYPRKYMPYDIQDDIEALLAEKPLPPPGANWKEEWRTAANEAERDTYRFQKGLNVFDQ